MGREKGEHAVVEFRLKLAEERVFAINVVGAIDVNRICLQRIASFHCPGHRHDFIRRAMIELDAGGDLIEIIRGRDNGLYLARELFR